MENLKSVQKIRKVIENYRGPIERIKAGQREEISNEDNIKDDIKKWSLKDTSVGRSEHSDLINFIDVRNEIKLKEKLTKGNADISAINIKDDIEKLHIQGRNVEGSRDVEIEDYTNVRNEIYVKEETSNILEANINSAKKWPLNEKIAGRSGNVDSNHCTNVINEVHKREKSKEVSKIIYQANIKNAIEEWFLHAHSILGNGQRYFNFTDAKNYITEETEENDRNIDQTSSDFYSLKTTQKEAPIYDSNIIDNKKYYECYICDFKTIYKPYLNVHIKAVHEKIKPFKCQICGHEFALNHHLKLHINSYHNKLKPHKCQICGYEFSQKGHLKSHVNNVHNKMKKYKCKSCGNEFSSGSNLKRHTESVHYKINPFKCSLCAKPFSNKADLKRHMNSKRAHLLGSQ